MAPRVYADGSSPRLHPTRCSTNHLERAIWSANGHWPSRSQGLGRSKSLRQAFLDGALDRLLNPDEYLRYRIPEFVARGEFGLASGREPATGFTRVWFSEPLSADEIAFDSDVYLLTKTRAKALKMSSETTAASTSTGVPTQSIGDPIEAIPPHSEPIEGTRQGEQKRTVHIVGSIPPEVWNRIGTKLIPKLRSGANLRVGLEFAVELDSKDAAQFLQELKQVLADLNLTDALPIVIR